MTATLALGLVAGAHWIGVRDGDPRLVELYRRHYSANPNVSATAQRRHGVSGVGESMILLTLESEAGLIWVRNTTERYDGQGGIQCSFFRNESPLRSSELIREADDLARQRWPDAPRHWTYVNPGRIRHKRDPGRCFIKAGWRRCGESKGGLIILERFP